MVTVFFCGVGYELDMLLSDSVERGVVVLFFIKVYISTTNIQAVRFVEKEEEEDENEEDEEDEKDEEDEEEVVVTRRLVGVQ